MTPFCKWPIKFGFVGEGPLTKFIQISWRNKRKIASPQIIALIFKSSRKEMARTICFSDRNSQFPYLNGNALEPKGVPEFPVVFVILVRVPLCYKLRIPGKRLLF